MRIVRGSLYLALALLMVALLVWPGEAQQQPAPAQNVFYTVQQGAFSATLTPVSSSGSVVDFYNYSNFSAHSGLEVEQQSILFIYRDPTSGQASLVIIHSKEDGNSPAGSVTFDFSGLPPGVQWQVQDDADDSYTLNPPTGQAIWNWQAGFTDGAVLGPLPDSFKITITPTFTAGINDWALVSGDPTNPQKTSIPSLTKAITITATKGQPPTADFTFSPAQPSAGLPLTFDASASRAPAGNQIVNYEWDFNNDGIFEVSTTSPTVQHTFDQTGDHTVALRVTDNRGVTATVSKKVTVVEVSSEAVQQISTPAAAPGMTFRVTTNIKVRTPVNGLGLQENVPAGWKITPVDNGGATFKPSLNQWVFPQTIRSGETRRIVLDVTVPNSNELASGPLPATFDLSCFIESASPAFEINCSGEQQVELVSCLPIKVAVAHLTPEDVIDLRLDEQITADQLQRAVGFWLEDAGVPGTCAAAISLETMKDITAREISGTPVDQPLPVDQQVGATVTRTILTPLPFHQVIPSRDNGNIFRVRLQIKATRELDGLGLNEVLPSNWKVQPIDNDGASFKASTREWLFTGKIRTGQQRTVVYQVTVPRDEPTGCINFQGRVDCALPQFESDIQGDGSMPGMLANQVCVVQCLSVPVAIAHLDTSINDINVTLSNVISFDQIQAAIAFWLEDATVPGTCGKQIDFEMMKMLIAYWLTGVPVDQPVPAGVQLPPTN
ncbi:MAG TPA: PKD domain-containing protein [Candidatus Fraserbacteria bacterium]|nr:PKD domain-containing protein [Candidatus Fraserbacteria bacterium]